MKTKLPEFPHVIKKGNSTVTIYHRRKGEYDEFRLAFYDGAGVRKQEYFSEYSDAKKRADAINDSVNDGSVNTLSLTGEDRLAYVRAKDALADLKIPLEVAVLEFAEARKILGKGSLTEAARFYAQKMGACVSAMTVPEVVAEYLEVKEKETTLSRVYVADLKYRCNKFATAFQTGIQNVTARDITDFINALGLAPRSCNNFRDTLKTFFEYAKGRGYLPKDFAEFDNVVEKKIREEEVQVYTPQEMQVLLEYATPAHVPVLAIGGFAGIRQAELTRIDWTLVKATTSEIEITKEISKTNSTRIIPIQPNLAKWLANHWKESGKVWPFTVAYLCEVQRDLVLRIRKAAKEGKLPASFEKFEWKHNALRHSFVSYRLAATQNKNQTALEAGHSLAILNRNYLRTIGKPVGEAWFEITPGAASNILPSNILPMVVNG